MSRISVVFIAFLVATFILTALPVEAEESDTTEQVSLPTPDFTLDFIEDVNPNAERVNVGSEIEARVTSSSDGGALPPGWECGGGVGRNTVVENDLVEPVYNFVEESAESGEKSNVIRATQDAPDGAKVGSIGANSPAERYREGIYDSVRRYSPSGRWEWVICTGAGGETTVFDYFPVGGPAVTLSELLDQALASLDPPVHDYQVNPEGKQLTQFPTLFWVEPIYWEQDRSTTVGNGNVFLTATLVPYETEWDPGDGGAAVVCDGPGEVWSPGLDSDNFDCKHTYQTVEGEPFTLSSTVRFEIGTETNSTEVIGPFPPLERIATTEVGVREIQGVETNPD